MSENSKTDQIETEKTKPGKTKAWKQIFSGRQEFAMFLLGIASGLPYVLVGGTLNAWLTTEGINPKEIGVLSWITLAYAFKFMWAAALQKRTTPFDLKIGPRRFWLGIFLILSTIGIAYLANIKPATGLGMVGLIAVGIALLSASFDIVLAAWRIESAKNDTHLDALSAIEQFGYRIASFMGGFVALLAADHFGWKPTFLAAAALLLFCGLGVILARPSPVAISKKQAKAEITILRQGLYLTHSARKHATIIVMAGWAISLFLLGKFMVGALTDPDNHSATQFLRSQSPIVVGLTVGVLVLVSAILIGMDDNNNAKGISPDKAEGVGVFFVLYRAILEPMMELVYRLRWALLVIFPLILSYRFTDAVWGSFAYPFYLDENYGALGHSLSEVGVASKFIGVIATIAGIALGGLAMVKFGRMPIMLTGAVLAALTNLLFADLAMQAKYTDAFLQFTRLGPALESLHFNDVGVDRKLARLITVIFAENIAGGMASVASVAYLSSIVNKKYAATQYALLVSLTFLIGILARPAIGAYIETGKDGYAKAFILCTWLGGFAVVFVILEWIRRKRANNQNSQA